MNEKKEQKNPLQSSAVTSPETLKPPAELKEGSVGRTPSQSQASSKTLIPVVGIGASAGGLEAFSDFLRSLPVNTGMAFVFIQHLDPHHVSLLSSILAKTTLMKVLEVENEMQVKPNTVYVIPPNTCMTISEGLLNLVPRPEGQGETNHPIDTFFESLAKEKGTQAMGVVLSGTASDGSSGIMAIKENGGITFAQESDSAKFDQMPRNAIATGCVDMILSPEKIAGCLEYLSSNPYANPTEIQLQAMLPETEEAFNQIVLLLKKASGVDFVSYKPATIKRRVVRRMVLSRKDNLGSYLELLKSHPEEIDTLLQDVLIKVTRFFRDSETFEILKRDVFPEMIKNKSNEAPLRIWVPACSTGEEVYSLAIVLLEYLGDDANHIPIQFFGSDIKDSCIEAARAAVYPETIVQDVSAERLRRFFNKVERGYQITKVIRDRCVFAKQNVTADPPFSRVDFISCRNFLIYLTPVLQKAVIPIFHYALNPEGFLLLGQSESVMSFQHLFKSVNSKSRIYSKLKNPNTHVFGPISSQSIPAKFPALKRQDQNEESRIALHAQREADRVVIAKFEQAGVVINEAMEILQFRGDTSYYLKQAPGTPSLNLLKMAREGLITELRSAMVSVLADAVPFAKGNIRIKYNETFKNVHIEIIPLKVPAAQQKHFLVSFGEMPPMPESLSPGKPAEQFKWGLPSRKRDSEVSLLKEELISSKAYMQSIIEEREAVNVQLQAGNEEVVTSNEELQSLNEEMQSTNEELQTAKEELQASNEEITTVNDELNNRNLQLSQLNDDFTNLTKSIQLPAVIIGRDLKIRFFTTAAEKVFSLVPTDVGRPINDIKLRVNINDLEAMILGVLKDLVIKERQVQDESGHWYDLQIRPYQTSEKKIDGVVVTFSDIDALKKNEYLIEKQTQDLVAVIQTVSMPLLVLDAQLRVKMTNESFCKTFQFPAKEIESNFIYELGEQKYMDPGLRKLLEEVMNTGVKFSDYEISHVFERVGHKVLKLNASQIKASQLILLAIEDITVQKQRETELEELSIALKERSVKLQKSNVDLEQFAAVASHDLQEPFHIITSFMTLLTSGYKDKLEPKAQELIKITGDAAGRAQNLIRSLLDYARYDNGEQNLENVEIKSILERVTSDLSEQIKESKAEIETGTMPKIVCDPLHLGRLFQNLISNAIKYRSHRPLKIQISAKREQEAWLFQITDNGIGFADSEKSRIFDMFKRLQSKQASGAGIGLATCRKIVERHGGKIWAESEIDKGASFYFSIPVRRTDDGSR